MAKPVVAIIGRPNVGKSTLFNRLIGERRAIVEDLPGTTRDRLYGDTDWNGREFVVVDTAGLEVAPEAELYQHIQDQVEQAISAADVVVMLTDVRTGVHPVDFEVAQRLRRANKKVVLAVNKAEGPKLPMGAHEFWELGLDEPIAVSALQGHGIGDLLDAIVNDLPESATGEVPETGVPNIAIIGRPNVGKSSILNKLLGSNRSVVSATPGTTRDVIDSPLTFEGRKVVLLDTAGIRRRGKVEVGIEKFSVLRSVRAVNRADVVILVIDGFEGPTAQDTHVASYALDAKKSIVIAANKWDLVDKDAYTADTFISVIREAFKFLPDPPIVFVSAMTGQRVVRLIREALVLYDTRQQRVSTGTLNQLIARAVDSHHPPNVRGRQLKVYYVTQADVDPPTFVFFVNDPKLIHFSYQRFLENRIREAFPFPGTPINLVFRRRDEAEEK